MNYLTLTAILATVVFGVSGAQGGERRALVDYINPIIGANTEGKTFPGPTTPFGLVQLSPDTITGGDNGSGYAWEHKTIEGFSLTHMSGIGWYGDLGNFLVMPTTPTNRFITPPICSPTRALPGCRKNGRGSSWTTLTATASTEFVAMNNGRDSKMVTVWCLHSAPADRRGRRSEHARARVLPNSLGDSRLGIGLGLGV